jgi:L-histidine N-alpha-methyltransferase
MSVSDEPFTLEVHLDADAGRDRLAWDVRRGLIAPPRWILPKYLYDPVGCALYEQITELDEYYQARTEMQILARAVDGIMARHRPTELVELGSGSSRKTRALLDGLNHVGSSRRYLPFDVSSSALHGAAHALAVDYPDLTIHAIAGDFEHHLAYVPPRHAGGVRMVAFLGGTIGNISPGLRPAFLRDVAGLLAPGDVFLMGVDLDTDPERTRRAYDDAAGVTARFNRNLLVILNNQLDADFDPESFVHRAVWRPDERRVEMRLQASREMRVRLGYLDAEITIANGEEILTEICCKFNEPGLREIYADVGLDLIEWHTDPESRFAVTVARLPAGQSAGGG